MKCPECKSEKLECFAGAVWICTDCKTLYFRDKEGKLHERAGHLIKK